MTCGKGVAIVDDRCVTWINTVSASLDICKLLPKIYRLGANHLNRGSLHFSLFPLIKVLTHILITSFSGTLLDGSAGRCVGGGLYASSRNPLAL